jgi:hypothetical protein
MRCPACRTPFFGAAQQAEVSALEEMMGSGSTLGTGSGRTEEVEMWSERIARMVEVMRAEESEEAITPRLAEMAVRFEQLGGISHAGTREEVDARMERATAVRESNMYS